MRKRVVLSALLFLCAVVSAASGKKEHFAPSVIDFSGKHTAVLKGGAAVSDGVLKLDGKKGFALIPSSSNFNITEKGLTLTAVVKMDYDPASSKLPERVDMFLFKNKEFLFGKLHNQLYVNIFSKGKWSAGTVIDTLPAPGEWTHVAAVIERFYDPAQSDVGYRVSIYVNGELEITKKHQGLVPASGKAPVDIGRGFGGPWHLKGNVASAAVYGRALTAAEIAKLCSQEKRVKAGRRGFYPVPAQLDAELKKLDDGSNAVKWAASALRRAAENGTGADKLLAAAKTLYKFRKDGIDRLAGKFNASGLTAKIVMTGDLAVLVLTGQGRGMHPVAGVMDLKRGKDIFGERTVFWEILWHKGKQSGVIAFNSPDVSWNSSLSGKKVDITWTGKGKIPFVAKSSVSFDGSRMESDFNVKNGSGVIFDSVRYPQWSFAPLGEGDVLVHPYMSGVLVNNPLYEQFRASQSGTYPSGRVTMQFGAYFNKAKDGIYFAYEDPKGDTKSYNVVGKRNNLNVSWQNPVIADKGKNNFTMSGKAVVELCRGSWYEAGEIYRRFLEQKAVWWIKDLPRKTTPDWFRNNTLWIRMVSKKHYNVEQIRDALVYLRSYFDMPYNVHWYEWNDGDVAGWPHFPAKSYTPAILKSLKKADIRVLPYIDDRLWRQKDGPGGKTDWKYSSEGKKYAVRSHNGSLYTEDYGNGWIYTVMCPAAKGWQDILVNLTERLSNEGFNGAYHDQVGTAAPKLCYDRSHGHSANDASLWLKQGYWKIFDRIFAILHKKDPAFCHTTEESGEVYLKQFDGFLVARWTDAEQIPLFQSIYSGRVQFVGRNFNCLSQGSYQSFFSKLAQQLVNAEQLGWFQYPEVSRPDHRRLFVKKAMYVRAALLKFFNEGRMLAPIDFGDTMKYEKCVWSGYVPHVVTMPRIPSSAWQGSDGSRMWLFVNSTRIPTEVKPEIKSTKGIWICREGAEKPVFASVPPKVNLKGLEFEVWIEGSYEQASAIQRALQKISTFDRGQEIFNKKLNGKVRRTAGVPEKFYGVSDCFDYSMCRKSGTSHFGWVLDGAVIDYGEIDFGTNGISELTVKYAADKAHAGGSIEVLMGRAGAKYPKTAAQATIVSTGSWKKFDTLKIPLEKRLGKQRVFIRINGNSACNFAGWSYK